MSAGNQHCPPPAAAPGGFEVPFACCPLCQGEQTERVGEAECRKHPFWQEGLPTHLRWVRCKGCSHMYRTAYLSPTGNALLFSRSHDYSTAGIDMDQMRAVWADIVSRVVPLVPDSIWNQPTVWLDIGCGDGGLVFTASEFGFHAIGVDTRKAAVDHITALGFNAILGDVSDVAVTDPVDVVSLFDVLEHVPFPREVLKRLSTVLKPGGVIALSCPNCECVSWRVSSNAGKNPYWAELEHYHNFSRTGLMQLLVQEGFTPVDYQVSRRYKSCMEIIAVQQKPVLPA